METPQTAPAVTYEPDHPDGWQRRCGNATDTDGIDACNADGVIAEPTVTNWKDDLWKCNACGVIFHADDVRPAPSAA